MSNPHFGNPPNQPSDPSIDRASMDRPEEPTNVASFLPKERHELALLEHYSKEGQNLAAIRELLPKMQMVVVEGESIQGFFIQKKPLQLCPMTAIATSRRLFLYKRKLLGGAEMEEYAWQWLSSPQLQHHALHSSVIIKFAPPNKTPLVLHIDWLPRPQAQRLFQLAVDINNFWGDENRIRRLQMERAKSGGWMGTMELREIAKPSLPKWKQFDPAEEERAKKQAQEGQLQLEAGSSASRMALPSSNASSSSISSDTSLVPQSNQNPISAEQITPIVWEEVQSPSSPIKESSQVDLIAYLKELKDLLDQGIISQEEYDQKKAETLAKL